jgi:DNA (cytosine-5)-methyltransferase 1
MWRKMGVGLMQFSMFDGKQEFRFRKPIRLIEFFAGYGSQALALKELGVKFSHWRICEWAIKSIQAYKDNHFKDENEDYSQNFTIENIYKVLADWGISSNYNEPLTLEQVKRLGETECRKILNNILTTHNLVNISRVRGEDLQICDTDKYDYILTYSFPCQDLSKAGKGKGMARDSGTRSGLLWEVERILDECAELGALPQILLMENVPDVIGAKNLPHFRDWRDKLESMGYKCYWQVLNSKDYGIPQNRERCFMISILGDYYFSFPKEIQLPHKLIDILETNVDEKYYLSQKAIKGKLETKFRTTSFEGCLPQDDGCCRTLCARDYKDPKCVVEIGEPIACELRCDEGIRTFKDNIMGTLRTIEACGDKHIIEPTLKEQLCDRLVESGLLKPGTVINHSYTNGLNGKNPNSRQTLEDYIESENGICNCLTTRPDVLGIAVEDLTTKNKRLASMVDKIDPTKTQAIDMYNQSVHEEMHTIKTNVDKANMTAITQNLRIRKLTPRECFRLMGVRDKDFENIAENQSRASLYHLAGDSIVVAVLVAILSHFVDGFDFNKYIENFYEKIKIGENKDENN